MLHYNQNRILILCSHYYFFFLLLGLVELKEEDLMIVFGVLLSRAGFLIVKYHSAHNKKREAPMVHESTTSRGAGFGNEPKQKGDKMLDKMIRYGKNRLDSI